MLNHILEFLVYKNFRNKNLSHIPTHSNIPWFRTSCFPVIPSICSPRQGHHYCQASNALGVLDGRPWRIVMICTLPLNWEVKKVANVIVIPSGKRLHNYGKSQSLMGKLTISTSYVKLSEGTLKKSLAGIKFHHLPKVYTKIVGQLRETRCSLKNHWEGHLAYLPPNLVFKLRVNWWLG